VAAGFHSGNPWYSDAVAGLCGKAPEGISKTNKMRRLTAGNTAVSLFLFFIFYFSDATDGFFSKAVCFYLLFFYGGQTRGALTSLIVPLRGGRTFAKPFLPRTARIILIFS
jgi:hypothetical protein